MTLALSKDLVSRLDTWQPLGQTRHVNLGLQDTAAAAPEIGDMKISHKEVLPVDVTVLGRLHCQSLETFSVNGQSMTRVDVGRYSLDQLVSKAGTEQGARTWILRLAGVSVMWCGLVLLCGPVVKLADIVPFFGSFVGVSINAICGLLAVLLSAFIIALSWFAHRPLVSVALLAALGAVTYLVRGGRIVSGASGGGGVAGGLAPCLRDCAALKDDSSLFDVCTGACVKKYA